MKDHERRELTTIAGVSLSFVNMDWKRIPAHIKKKLENVISKSTKGEYRLVEDRGYDPYAPLPFDPYRYEDDDGDGIPNYQDPDYYKDPRYYPDHSDRRPEIPDDFNPNVPGGPFSNPFGYVRPAPGFYDPAFDPYVPVLPTPGATEPLDPPTGPVIPGTNPSSPFPFGLPYPYRPNTNPFAPGQPFAPEIAGTQTESMNEEGDPAPPVYNQNLPAGNTSLGLYTSGGFQQKRIRDILCDYFGICDDSGPAGPSDEVLGEERAKVPTYVIDRKTKKIVYGPTDTADAKLYLDKQIQPRKFMIRQIRGVAKKVGDRV